MAVKPASVAAAAPADAPSASAAADRTCRCRRRRSGSSVRSPGRNICRSSSQSSLPLVCEKRCTLGVQPPDISSASQAIVAGRRRPRRSAATGLTRTERMRSRPLGAGHGPAVTASRCRARWRARRRRMRTRSRGRRRSRHRDAGLRQIEGGEPGASRAVVTTTAALPTLTP